MDHPSMLLAANQFGTIHGILIAVIVFLLICSAFFSASETAFNSMNLIRVRTMAENKVKGARRALYISEHSDRALTTILVGNNIVNILSTTLCAFILGDLLENAALINVLNTVVMTIIILITGEILPKALAKANPEKFACKFSGILYFLMKVIYVIVIPFYALQKLFTKKKDKDKNNSITVTEDELESIIDTMEEEGVLEKEEAEIIQGTFKMKEATAHDIMTHRVDVVFLNVESTSQDIEKAFNEHQYSRMPVYKENSDNVVGILNIKDYFTAKIENKSLIITDVMTKPLFMAENTSVDTLIKEMQKAKKHMAVVIDENGGVSGIVTMEDCVETIFGEIYDETDQDEIEPVLEQINDDEYSIDAEITVEELFDRLEIETMPENKYQTINSFLFELSEDIAEYGKKYEYLTIDEIIDDEGNLTQHKINMIFTVTKMDGHRVQKLNLKIEYLNKLSEEPHDEKKDVE